MTSSLPGSRALLYGFGLVVLTVLTRMPLLVRPFPLDDERIYTVVANEIVDGGKPYVDAIERKPPLLFWTYAATYRVAGKYNWPGLHLVTVLWLLLTMAGCYVFGTMLFDRRTGLIAALSYSIFQPWWGAGTLAFNGEVAMNLPLIWAAVLAFRPSTSRVRPELFAAGALTAAGFLLKQPAAIAGVAFGVYLLLPNYRASRGLSWWQSVLQASALTLGFVVALGITGWVLRSQGILKDAIYWTILDHRDPYFSWEKALGFSALFVLICGPLTLGTLGSLRATRTATAVSPWSFRRPELLGVLLWTGVSCIGVAAGGRFYPHYFIQLVLPLSVLAAPHLASGLMARSRVLWAYLGLSAAVLLAWHAIRLARNPEASEAGVYVRDHSGPEDRIFVWGQQAPVYLHARRRPASRYITTFPLTGYVFGAPYSYDPSHDTSDRIRPGAWDHLAQDFARHPPLYIIDTDAALKVAKYPMASFPFLRTLIAEQYREVHRAADGVIYRRVGPSPSPAG